MAILRFAELGVVNVIMSVQPHQNVCPYLQVGVNRGVPAGGVRGSERRVPGIFSFIFPPRPAGYLIESLYNSTS